MSHDNIAGEYRNWIRLCTTKSMYLALIIFSFLLFQTPRKIHGKFHEQTTYNVPKVWVYPEDELGIPKYNCSSNILDCTFIKEVKNSDWFTHDILEANLFLIPFPWEHFYTSLGKGTNDLLDKVLDKWRKSPYYKQSNIQNHVFPAMHWKSSNWYRWGGFTKSQQGTSFLT